jgi:tetratricopeptide (TPR) repeat protein
LPIETRDPKSLRGDLDNIVLMAIREEPARRYSSVDQFSEDIRRHLGGRPVIARKDTWRYRSSKFVRRNKTAVVASALVVLSLIAGIITTSWQARVAKAERAKAERRFNEVRHLANSSLFELHDAIEKLPGSTAARELLVRRALEYLDSLGQEARDDPSLQRELTSAYIKVGNVQGNPNNANLGDPSGALVSYRKGLALIERLVATRSNAEENAQARRLLAVVQEKMADVLAATGQIRAAVQYSDNSLGTFQSIADAQPKNIKARQSLGISHIKSGDVLGNPNFPNAGDAAGALQHYRTALDIWKNLARSDPEEETSRRFLGVTYERVGTMLEAQGNFPEALAKSLRPTPTLFATGRSSMKKSAMP